MDRKIRKKKFYNYALAAGLTFFVTGCWDYNELDREASVSLFGNDFSDNGTAQISMEIRKQSDQSSEDEGNGKMGKSVIMSASGPTFFDAIQNTSREAALRLDFTHDIGSVFSEDVLKSTDFRATLDRIVRIGETRRRELFLATSHKAVAILQADASLKNDVGEELLGLTDETAEQQTSPKTDLNDFLYDIGCPGIDPIMPRIEVKEDTENRTNRLSLEGCAAMRHLQFAGWFTGDETRGILWLRNKSGHPTLTFSWNGQKVTVQTLAIHAHISLTNSSNFHKGIAPEFTAMLDWTGDLVMYSGRKRLTLHDLNSIQQKVNDVVSSTVATSLQKAQSLPADVYGFGKVLYNRDPVTFKKLYGRNWDERGFAISKIHTTVKSKLNSLGYTQQPPLEG